MVCLTLIDLSFSKAKQPMAEEVPGKRAHNLAERKRGSPVTLSRNFLGQERIAQCCINIKKLNNIPEK
jgi:hypothetical protein